jgi:hypothetical protein
LVSEISGESVFSTFIGIVCDTFILANDYLLSVSIFALIAPYVGLVILYTCRIYFMRPVLNKVNAVVSSLYYRKNKYSLWRQSLRTRRRMNVFALLQLFAAYSKKILLKTYHYLLTKRSSRRNVFVSSDDNAFRWKNMNCGVDIHQMTASSNAGRVSLLAVLPSRDAVAFCRPEVVRSSYTTTVLNAHRHKEDGETTDAPAKTEDTNRKFKEDMERFTLNSNSRHQIKEYYSSFFQLPQEDSFFINRRRFNSEGSNSESTDEFADLDYVIDLTRNKNRVNEEIRERSKNFRAQKYAPTTLRPLFEDGVEHKEGEVVAPYLRNTIVGSKLRKLQLRPRIRIGKVDSHSIDKTNETDNSYDSSVEDEKGER